MSEQKELGKTAAPSNPKLQAIDSTNVQLPPAIGPYKLERLLGRGGMAAVYLTSESGTDRQVALKLMDPSFNNDEGFVARFLSEAKAVEGLRHPHVVETYAWGEADGWRYLATEFVEGGTVHSMLRQMGRLPIPVALEIFAQLMGGLQAAHNHGIVHRDLKPENLLLTWGGILKIGDFGIARTVDSQKLTKTGMLVGTVGYMSPEQAKGEKIDLRSDIFACGTIFYELLTGKNPFLADNASGSLMKILSGDVPLLFEDLPWIPYAVESIVEKCLQQDRDARFQSADEIMNALLPLIAETRIQRPTLVSESLRRPNEMRTQFDQDLSKAFFAEAESALKTAGRVEKNKVAMKLMSAKSLDPSNGKASELLNGLIQELGLRSGTPKNQKIPELEMAVKRGNAQPAQFLNLANLYKIEGNLFRSAIYLRKYLRARPQDTVAHNQYFQVTGEKLSDSGNVKLGPGTRELIDGIKTGGFKAKTVSMQVTQLERSPLPMGESSPADRFVEGSTLRSYLPKIAIALAVFGVGFGIRKALQKSETPIEIRSSVTPTAVPVEPNPRYEPARPTSTPVAGQIVIPVVDPIEVEGLRAKEYPEIVEYLRQAENYLQLKNPAQALVMLDSAAIDAKTVFHMRKIGFLRAKTLLQLNRNGDAAKEFAALIDGEDELASESLLRRGQCYAQNLDFDTALEDFDRFVHRYPMHKLRGEAYFRRGEIFDKRADRTNTIASMNIAMGLLPDGAMKETARQMVIKYNR
jgi:serine/threonine protein kinase